MFIAKNNDLIILVKDTREELEKALQFMVHTSIEETDVRYELYNGSYLTPEEIAAKEAERVAKLTMTALDFINFLQLSGLTLEQINAYLEANLAVKMQLTYCQNVYCGVACALMPITVGDITITKEMVIEAFKKKNGEV